MGSPGGLLSVFCVGIVAVKRVRNHNIADTCAHTSFLPPKGGWLCPNGFLSLLIFIFEPFYTFLGRHGGRERCRLHLRRRLVRLSFPCDGVRAACIQLKTYTCVYIAFYPCIFHQCARFYIKNEPTHRASCEDNIVRGRWFKKAV